MSIIYTLNDYKALHGIIDVFKHNVRNETLFIKDKVKLSLPDPSEDSQEIYSSIFKLVRWLAPTKNDINDYKEFAFTYPVEELPLLMGRHNNLDLIIQWRIDIGK